MTTSGGSGGQRVIGVVYSEMDQQAEPQRKEVGTAWHPSVSTHYGQAAWNQGYQWTYLRANGTGIHQASNHLAATGTVQTVHGNLST